MAQNENEYLHDMKKIAHLWNELKDAMDQLFFHHAAIVKREREHADNNPDNHSRICAGAGSGATDRIHKRTEQEA
jgi:hypothetical protein